MVTVDSTATPVRLKRRGKGARSRQKRRHRIRQRSVKLVKSGRVELTPCIVYGSTQNLTIHHVEPIQPDRFVFLCEECHVLAHKPVFCTMKVCVASGHFSIRPEAVPPPPDTPPPIGAAPVRKRSVPLTKGDHRGLLPTGEGERVGHSQLRGNDRPGKAVARG